MNLVQQAQIEILKLYQENARILHAGFLPAGRIAYYEARSKELEAIMATFAST
jgi:hypothetical protein